ncbi:GntR family transcriptional regulator [Pseudomonas putida]
MSIKSQAGFAYQAVYRYLSALIDAGEPGVPFRLPSLRSLATRLGVSVSTIQTSYTLLEREGRVYAIAKSGYYARPPARAKRPQDGGDLLQRIQTEQRRLVPLLELDVPLLKLERQAQKQYATLPGPAWHPTGDPELRTALAARYTQGTRHRWNAGHVYLGGDLRGLLDITFEALALAGEPVVVVSPCCPLVLQALRLAGAMIIELPLNDAGRLNLATLQEHLHTLPVRLMVMDAGFSSVHGTRMPDADLSTLSTLLNHHDVWLLENDVQGALGFEPCRYLRDSLPAYRTLVVGSLEPWLGGEAPFAYLLTAGAGQPLEAAFQRRALRLPPLRQKALARLLEQGWLDEQLPYLRMQLQQQLWRIDRQVRARLGRHLLAIHPVGGTGLWLRSRYPLDMRKVFERLLSEGQVVEPGPLFSAHGLHERYVRINGLGVDSEALETLLAALGDAMAQERKALEVTGN